MKKYVGLLLAFSMIFALCVVPVSANTAASVVYTVGGETDGEAVTGLNSGEVYSPDRMPTAQTPDDKYFAGWADESGNLVSQITLKSGENRLVAVYKDYPSLVYADFSFSKLSSGSRKQVFSPCNIDGVYDATINSMLGGWYSHGEGTENGASYSRLYNTTAWSYTATHPIYDSDGAAIFAQSGQSYDIFVTYRMKGSSNDSATLTVGAGISYKDANKGGGNNWVKCISLSSPVNPDGSKHTYSAFEDGYGGQVLKAPYTSEWTTVKYTMTVGDLSECLPVFVYMAGVKGGCELHIKDIVIKKSDYSETAYAEYYNGNDFLTKDTVNIGDTLRTEMEVNGKIFKGWYNDKELKSPTEYVLNTNTKVYGNFIDKSQKINIKYMYNNTVLKDDECTVYSKLWNAQNAVSGKTLGGWYTDKELTKSYDSIYAETENLVLYGDFKDYVTDVTLTQWPTQYEKINVYAEYADKLVTEFDAGGWTYDDAKKVKDSESKLILANCQTWVQGGGVILYDPATGDILTPEPSGLYEVSIEYTVPKLDASNVSVSIGYGYSKSLKESLSNTVPSVSETVGSFTEAVTEIQKASFVYNVPEDSADILPCFTIYASFAGRKDASNSSPVSYIAISKVTVKKLEVKGINYDGASVLTDEAEELYGSQALRVYFSYTLNENGKMVASDGTEYTVKERGVLLKADGKSDASLVIDNAGKNGVRSIRRFKNLDDCWEYDSETGKLTFSIRVTDLLKNDTNRIQFRGYAVLDNNMVCYSDISTISVNDIKNAVDTDKPENGEKEKIAILLVIGQSNAEGAGYGEEREIVKASNGLWQLSAKPTTTDYGAVYLSNTGSVTSLSPAYEYSTNWSEKVGGFAPSWAARWYELTGERVVILQMAVGATGLAEWQKDANTNFSDYKELNPATDRGYNGEYYLYKRAVKAFNETYEALSGNYEISTAFYAWNQGENAEGRTDSSENTIYNDATYAEYYEKMHNDFMADCPGLQYGTITAVRSCRNTSHSQNKWWVSGVSTNARRAQYRLAAKLDNLYFVSWHTETCTKSAPGSFQTSGISETVWGGNYDLVPSFKGCSYMFSNMHLTQLNYNIIGKESAENLFNSLKGNMNFDGVAVRDGDGDLIGKFSADGEGNFKLKNDGTTRTRYMQIRAESGSCTYDFSLSVDIENKQLKIDLYTDGSHHASGDTYISEFGEIDWSALQEKGIDELSIVCNIH